VFLVVSLRVFQSLSPPQESSEVALGQRNPGQRRLVGGWNATRFEIIPVLGYSGKRASSLVDRVCFEAVGLQAVGDPASERTERATGTERAGEAASEW